MDTLVGRNADVRSAPSSKVWKTNGFAAWVPSMVHMGLTHAMKLRQDQELTTVFHECGQAQSSGYFLE